MTFRKSHEEIGPGNGPDLFVRRRAEPLVTEYRSVAFGVSAADLELSPPVLHHPRRG
jgi:hypothetical protein